MTNQQQDPDLRALFRALREEDEGKAPSFPRLLSKVKNAQDGSDSPSEAVPSSGWLSRRRLAWGGSLLAAAAVAAIWLLPSQGTSDAEFVMAISAFSSNPAAGAWRSPTDALLELPGSEVLNTRPKLGGPKWTTLSGTSSRSNQL
jgi:hypothetical protein